MPGTGRRDPSAATDRVAHRGADPLAKVAAALAFVAGAYGATQATLNREVLFGLFGGGAWIWLALAWLGALVTGLAAVLGFRRPVRSADALTLGIPVVLLWVVSYQVLLQPYERFTVELTLPIATGVWAGLVEARGRGRPSVPRVLDRPFVAAGALIVFSELALRVVSHALPSPLLTTTAHAEAVQLASGRFEPGEVRWGFACNEDGFYDEPFLGTDQRARPVVAAVGDSFVAGIVPHPLHFATVAERVLGDVDVYAFGVPGVGPPVYRHLVDQVVLPLEPDAVVICLFAGNDLSDLSTLSGIDFALRQVFDEEQNVLRTVCDRAAQLLRAGERVRLGRTADFDAPLLGELDELEQAFPWIFDHHLERPTLRGGAYLDVVVRRAVVACSPHPERLAILRSELVAMRDASAPLPFGVALFPAEFQVEDALWDLVVPELEDRRAVSVERHRVQREVAEMCAELGIPLLDLLPTLLDAEVLPDGARHVFHLHDSHLNVRGNHVVGSAFASFVEQLLAESSSG